MSRDRSTGKVVYSLVVETHRLLEDVVNEGSGEDEDAVADAPRDRGQAAVLLRPKIRQPGHKAHVFRDWCTQQKPYIDIMHEYLCQNVPVITAWKTDKLWWTLAKYLYRHSSNGKRETTDERLRKDFEYFRAYAQDRAYQERCSAV